MSTVQDLQEEHKFNDLEKYGNISITEYFFNTMEYPHFFCIICGIHTHHKSRSSPEKFCINIACIDGFQSDYLTYKITNFDGINHPKDKILK